MSIEDFVGTGKPDFGMEFYEATSNKMRDKKPMFGKSDKSRICTFAEQIIKKKGWVPGPVYTKLYDWNGMKPKDHGKFTKSIRYTIAGEIEKRSNTKEKSSPGSNAYNEKAYNKSSSYKRTIGSYKTKENIITFVSESQNIHGESPLIKYDPIDMYTIRNKPKYPTIE